jgi:hypothetical protein
MRMQLLKQNFPARLHTVYPVYFKAPAES